ncbi:MAG: hypothetical protein ABI448_00285 [Bacteroidia bacterium]
MSTAIKFFFFSFFFIASIYSQTDTSKIVVQPIEVLTIRLFTPTIIQENKNAINNERTDSLRNCDVCKKKRGEFYLLKKRLKYKIDSAQKIANYNNTYLKDGCDYSISYNNEKYFNWEGCNDFISAADGHRWSVSSICYDCGLSSLYSLETTIIGCDVCIKKQQQPKFNMRLDGLTGEHIFYQEDLH